MIIVSKASVDVIKSALVSAYNAVMQDVTGNWEMPVSTFTAVTDSIARISVELGIDFAEISEEQSKRLEDQLKSAEIRLEAAKSALGGPQNEPD